MFIGYTSRERNYPIITKKRPVDSEDKAIVKQTRPNKHTDVVHPAKPRRTSLRQPKVRLY